jgi:hypothetical protein
VTTERHAADEQLPYLTSAERLARRRRNSSRRWVLAVAGALGIASLALYAAGGYSRTMLALWLGSVFSFIAFFESRTTRMPRPAFRDVIIPISLGALFIPLYLVGSHAWPFQVNSDEIVVMTASERWGSKAGADPFGVSDLFQFPALLFIVWGKLGQLIGDIDLGTMRLVHGAFGLVTIAASYALFRQLVPRQWAVFAAIVLGLSHSFFMLSRMAYRENTAVLVEIVALALLLQGLRREAMAPTFLGGLVAGLGYYVYYPGRAAIAVWLVFLFCLAVFFRKDWPLRKLSRFGLVAATGFVLMVGPIFIAERKAPPESVGHFRTELLLFPEGRELQKGWVSASSEWEGVRTNVVNGLTTFNNNTVDHSWLYANYGHGFVDPLAGGLLWLGVAITVVALIRRGAEPWMLLPLAGFVTIWLTLSFVVNKAPNYTRMLIVLPFVAFFVTQAVRFFAELITRYGKRRGKAWAPFAATAFAVAVLVGLGGWNLAIAYDFIQRGERDGNDLAGTGRYIEDHRDPPEKAFYLATGDRYPYFWWGWPSMWIDWMRMFAHDDQVTAVISPRRLAGFQAEQPLAIFMNRQLWTERAAPLQRRYPSGRVHDVMPDGRLVVFDVPRRG